MQLSYRERMTTTDVISALEETDSRVPMLESLSLNGVSLRIVPFLPLTRCLFHQLILIILISRSSSLCILYLNELLMAIEPNFFKLPLYEA